MVATDTNRDRPWVVDAHQHFWRTGLQEQPWRQPEHHRLESDFQPEGLAAELDGAGIDGTVLVQSVDQPEENDRLRAYATDRRVLGVVGWLPLRDPDAARTELDRLSIGKLTGVRCLIADDPLDWLAEPSVIELFGDLAARGLVWDVVPITSGQTDAVLALADAVPTLRIVVDHLGRPPLESGGWQPWAGQLERLARHPSVAVKASIGIDVLTAWPRWEPDALPRYLDHLLQIFGPDRMLLASNWPVVLLRADYQTAWHDLARQLTRQLTSAETAAVLGGTATRWYRLREPAPDL